jgi:hypothetical protein
MNLRKSLVLAILVTILTFFSAKPTQAAVDLLPYFTGNGTGNNISSGEYFKTDVGNGTFTINKSRDPGYYEQFKYDNSYIYHVKDTTWATETGDVECDNGDEADLSYAGGSTQWVPRQMEIGKSYSTPITVQGISSSTGKSCNTPHNGSTTRTVTLEYQGCITFPTGATSANAIELTINAGPGAGEHMYYDAERGWIGFNRGEDGTGAYVTDAIDSPTSGCKVVTVKTGSKLCPSGYTCVDTYPKPISGEVVHFSKSVTRRDVGSVLKGKTGPEENRLKLPQLDEEKLFYSSKEFFERALPAHLLENFNTNIDDPNNINLQAADSFPAKVGHPGCGDVFIDGANQGKNEREPKTTDFNTKQSYNKLLVLNRFWQSIFVPQKGTTLKVKAPTPQDGMYAPPPANTGDCSEDPSASVDNTVVNNTAPVELTALGNIFHAISNIIGGLPCVAAKIIGDQDSCKSVPVKLDFQQTKYIPGEVAFEKASVGQDGFLKAFKADFVPFTKDGKERDESEKTDYKVLDSNAQDVGNPGGSGVTEEGQAAFQTGTCDMINSMYPDNQQPCNGTLASLNLNVVDNTLPPGTGGLDFSIPYRDTSIRIPDSRRAKLIGQILASYPNSRIATEWDNVVNTAIASGINPAFAVTIWIEESAAGGAGQSDFGCFDGGNTDLRMTFNDSLRCFVNFTAKEHPNDFTDWVQYFCGPKAVPICSNNPNFLRRLKEYYGFVTSP